LEIYFIYYVLAQKKTESVLINLQNKRLLWVKRFFIPLILVKNKLKNNGFPIIPVKGLPNITI
jgi:hypothetical protein